VSLPDRTTSRALGSSAWRRITNWAAVVTWAAVIYYLSSLSRLPPAVATWSLAKPAHLIEYAILTLLLVRALHAHGLARSRTLWIAAMLAVGYAVTDEYHQSFVPNRHPSALDIVVDSIGISLASLLAASLYPWGPSGAHSGSRAPGPLDSRPGVP
jgi:VanZ family protein